ncbi:MAG: peptidylprolyl isomerase [Pseudanabaena sp. M158S2SP1A06QC]|jgi:peptidyl-prolyl cis-trans isomerase B (cyclophilin B)|uniref:peptidylprolyl isomerase n=1 Tax=Pseudanabaena mucicola TaxID=71190 RepID=UPI002578DB43|nr:peptidylprolyl isomerase [Pseudanabaena mucicola]MCA6574883.1 peptidylprolyl isomerase [Pseudanabaena sp. M53BS1SP1A06MG]MCA6580847.1 peptidylprolyl isomerase [Pseudanabaena sp. M34BS1SP1A06MG]MCA6586679.1 peptidylprolyl isomerase [Pseudanabaena sp. M051S1SP1A06QC]MCA6588564.1 peptidylprolyl isomerase [Pseudanabaena sp. M109S1SP1A06QC]MCA6594036.1 peptidylprolyl isomerase [Pseudanabaena sp. M38BS1SP1A06MG]MCA6597691.1 peptidylprolyl isomerase [Pseudanabaena sp. M046S1SP1A06QC]MCA6602439.1
MLRWILSSFLAISLLLTSCSNSSNVTASASPTASTTSTSVKSSPTKVAEATNTPNPQDSALAKFVQLKGTATVELKLKSGIVKIDLDGNNAPVTAGNFADLVKRGLYNGLNFHRVVKEPTPFVAQGGDPLGNGTGNFIDPVTSQPRYIPLEILPESSKQPVYGEILPPTLKPKLRHNKGAIAMARSQFPNSASSQFYIALDDIYFLDGSYAVFGYVTEGMDLVEKIQVGDRIESITITKGEENIKQPT